MSRADLNETIRQLVEKVVNLKKLLQSDATSWDIREVAAKCKACGKHILDICNGRSCVCVCCCFVFWQTKRSERLCCVGGGGRGAPALAREKEIL